MVNQKPFEQQTQQQLENSSESAWRRYARLVVGQPLAGSLLRYEVLTVFLTSFPGMLGYWLRQKLYPSLFHTFGKNNIIGRNVTIRGGKNIRLGSGVAIDDNVVLDARGENGSIVIEDGALISRNSIIRSRNGTITIGKKSDIGANCILATDSQLVVGSKVLVAAYSYLCAGGNHTFDRTDIPIIDQGFVTKGGVVIDDDVWIGAYGMIMDGVRVKRGAIVGSHSLVNKDVPAYAIVYGQPASIKGSRTQTEDQIDE